MKNAGLSLLVLFAADMERTVAFYRAIGLAFEEHHHPPSGRHYATAGGACLLEICQARDAAPRTSVTLGFQVVGLDGLIDAAVAAGGVLKRPPQPSDYGRTATVLDPDGNRVILTDARSDS